MTDKYTQALRDAGLRPPSRAAMADYPLAATFLYGLSGRTDASKAVLGAILDDEYRSAGYTIRSHSAYSVVIPGAAFAHYLEGQRAVQQPYQTTVTGSGAELVENTMRPDLFIDTLRSRSIVMSLGAQPVGGLKGDLVVPRMATASNVYWTTTSSSAITGYTNTTEVSSGALTESEGTFDATPLTAVPATVTAYGKISRNLLLQGGELANKVIANDVARGLSLAIDSAAISGPGTGGQPTGIVNTSGINTANGTTFAYATSVAAALSVANANAIINRNALGWAATPAVAGLLVQRPKLSGQAEFIWDGNVDTGNINGHRALSSTIVPASTAIFGDWSQVLVLTWGDSSQIEVEFNPFSGNFPGGDVQYRCFLSCNIVVRHPQSFTVVTSVS